LRKIPIFDCVKDVLTVAIIEDHNLVRLGLEKLLRAYEIDVALSAANGAEMIEKLKVTKKSDFPQIFIIDIVMPVMDGFETVLWLTKNHPETKIIVLTMQNSPAGVTRMIKLGVKSYLLKDIEPDELLKAIHDVKDNKFYFPSEITEILISAYRNSDQSSLSSVQISDLTEREFQFLKLACSELTYSEIAGKMQVSERTIDGFRNALFGKLGVKSRVGLALVAIKQKLFILND